MTALQLPESVLERRPARLLLVDDQPINIQALYQARQQLRVAERTHNPLDQLCLAQPQPSTPRDDLPAHPIEHILGIEGQRL